MKKVVLAFLLACATAAVGAQSPQPPGALAPANLKKPRPKAPFDLTGTWQHDGRFSTWHFVPETFKLTPEARPSCIRMVRTSTPLRMSTPAVAAIPMRAPPIDPNPAAATPEAPTPGASRLSALPMRKGEAARPETASDAR